VGGEAPHSLLSHLRGRKSYVFDYQLNDYNLIKYIVISESEMDKITFSEVRDTVLKWFTDNNDKFNTKGIKTKILTNTTECIRISFETEKCTAELISDEQNFSPYRYVFFQALTYENDMPKQSYFWADNENDTPDSIVYNLDMAISAIADNE
jgi:hypothetical protein